MLRKENWLQCIKKFIHNAVVISTELFYNESVMEINPIVEKMRKLLHHSSERAGTTSGSTARYPQRFQLPLLHARGTDLEMELMLPAL